MNFREELFYCVPITSELSISICSCLLATVRVQQETYYSPKLQQWEATILSLVLLPCRSLLLFP